MPDPVLSSLSPDYALVGSSAPITVEINGTDFDETAVLVWNGADDICQYISPTLLTTEVNMGLVSVPSDATVAVRVNEILSNELVFQFRDSDPNPLPKPDDSESPNTPAVPAAYMAPDPPDVYQNVTEAGYAAPGTTADGEPHPELMDDNLPTSNVKGGGLPTNPKEPYPVGSPPPPLSYGQINGRP